ncbi:hypothetical protein [Flavobacterium aestivum]|uniref:hypothetical protein n=1 Tax=Flavobacterium aestivum TaxID=3003257 RepID=UPI0024829CCA|nr:hypothetical protein [Flavobacterium aestivum]
MNYIRKMVGILKIRTFILLIIAFNIFSGCKNKEDNFPQKIIVDNFLGIVDTFAYKFGTFRPIAPDPRAKPIRMNSYSQLSIYLDKRVDKDKDIEGIIINFLKDEKLDNKFKELINNKYLDFTFDSKFPRKIGKYYITFDSINSSKFKYAGEVRISNFRISDNSGYFVVHLSDRKKSHVGLIVIIEKINDKWIIIKRKKLYIS